MYLLDISGISYKVRGNPVYVSRALSATVSSDQMFWIKTNKSVELLSCARFVSRLVTFSRFCRRKCTFQQSVQANQSDENGVLVGNWSGDYEGGASPTSWAGSIKIIQQFYETKQPVLFGQCWVFSGVLTSRNAPLLFKTVNLVSSWRFKRSVTCHSDLYGRY